MAISLLRAGLPYNATDRAYMENALQLAAEGEDFDFWLEACEMSLKGTDNRPDLAALRLWTTQRKITGLTEAGQFTEAVRLADASGADTNESFAELKVLALLKNGEADNAAKFTETWRHKNGPSLRILPLQARALREAGRREDMERMLSEWCRLDSTNPTPYINWVACRASLNDKEGAQNALDTFFLRFNSYPEYLIKLSETLVPLGESDLSRQCVAQAESQGFATYTLKQLLMESCITEGNLTEAQEILDQLAPLHEPNDPLIGYWVLMTRLVAASLDPSTGVQSNLLAKVQEQRLSMLAYRRLITVLRSANKNATALDITRLALSNYPNSTALQKTADTLQNALTATEVAKPKQVITAVKLDSAAADKIQAATRATLAGVDNEDVFFKNLDDKIKAGKADDALAAIRTARSSQPEWLVARDDELSLIEIRLYAGQKDVLTLQRLARLYLKGDLLRSNKILEIATEFHTAGDPDSAILLVQEILRASPSFKRAKKVLDTWIPPEPAKQAL
jgi:tetratricopeptide (TPR) repeat protein